MSATMAAAGETPLFDPMAVVREFTRHWDPQRRISAAKALRLIGTRDAACELIEMVVAETDDRDAIEHEVLELFGELMGQSDSLEAPRALLLEQLDAAEPVKRANALEMLLALHLFGYWEDDPLTARALADAAVGSGTASLTLDAEAPARRAEELLARLNDTNLDAAAARLVEIQREPGRKHAASLLLARLRRRGSPLGRRVDYLQTGESSSLKSRAFAWSTRLVNAWDLSNARAEPRLPAPYFNGDAVVPALLFGLLGASIMAMALAASTSIALGAFYPLLFLASIGVSVGLALAGSAKATPLFLQYDAWAGALVAVLRAAMYTAVLSAVACTIMMVVWSMTLPTALAIGLVCTAAVVSVRIGTMIGFYTLPAGVRRNTWVEDRWWPTFWLEILTGTGAGAVCLWTIRWFAARSGSSWLAAIEGLWMFVTPSMAAVAASFAIVDRPLDEPGGTTPLVNWTTLGSLLASSVFAAAAIVMTIGPIARFFSTPPPPAFPRADSGTRRVISAPLLDQHGADVQFGVAFPQDVAIEVTTPRRGDRVALYYHQPAGVEMQTKAPVCTDSGVESVLGERQLRYRLQWGCYRVGLDRSETASAPVTRLMVTGVIRARTGFAENPASLSEANVLTVRLNDDAERSSIEQARDDTEYDLKSGTSNWLLTSGRLKFKVVSDLPSAVEVNAARPTGIVAEIRRTDTTQRVVKLPSVDIDDRPLPDLGSNGAPPIQGTVDLERGSYVLQFSRGAGQRDPRGLAPAADPVPAMGASITVIDTIPTGAVAQPTPGHMMQAIWRFPTASLPYRARFTTTERRRLRAVVPPLRYFDLELSLSRVEPVRELVADADDPEDISVVVEPGTYEFEVKGSAERATGRLAERGLLELYLSAPIAAGAQR